jgi:hypothetical protein
MLMAARKLQGIGLVLLVLIIAMALYPLYLRVAATRSELAQIERDIVRTRDNVRYLESELVVRASMRQLERWNADSFGYSAPVASQYLHSERELAALDRVPRARDQMPVAPVLLALASPVPAAVSTPAARNSSVLSDVAEVVVPAARAAPVTAATRTPRADAMRVTAGEKGKLAAVAVTVTPVVKSLPKPTSERAERPAAKPAPVRAAATIAAVAPAPAVPVKASAERRRKERLALIEDQLLSDATLRDLRQQAAKEEARSRP